MAKNNKFWKTFVAGSEDKRHAAITGEDPLEEGLKDLTWFENSKRAVRRKITKTYETFGEEIETPYLRVSLRFIFSAFCHTRQSMHILTRRQRVCHRPL